MSFCGFCVPFLLEIRLWLANQIQILSVAHMHTSMNFYITFNFFEILWACVSVLNFN